MNFWRHGQFVLSAFVAFRPNALPRPRRIAAWFGLALAVRLVLLAQPLRQLDRIFIPDDSYYSLSIARQIAMTGVPSTDGVIATNGFQPLITLLQVPLFLFHTSAQQAAFAAVCISALFGAAGVAALGALAALGAGEAAGWLAAVIASVHPAILNNDMSGMETSLAGFLGVLCSVLVFAPSWRRGGIGIFAFGLLLGTTLLARVDSACLVAACLLLLAARDGPRTCVMASAGLLSVAVPWAIWIHAVTGLVFPESGRAVRQLIMFHMRYDVGLLATSLLSFCELGRLLPLDAGVSLLATMAGLVVAVFLLTVCVKTAPTPAIFFLLCSLALAAVYFLYLPAFWFLSRYLQPLYLAGIAAWAIIAAKALRRDGARAARVLAGGATAAVLLACAGQFPALLGYAPGDPFHGFGTPAQALAPYLARFRLVGAIQSGALAYYAPPGTRVVNLDGVVNRQAYCAMRDGTMDSYLRTVGIQALADYTFSTPLVALRAQKAPRLRLVATMPDARKSHLALYAIPTALEIDP
jgi:hypothetical protein